MSSALTEWPPSPPATCNQEFEPAIFQSKFLFRTSQMERYLVWAPTNPSQYQICKDLYKTHHVKRRWRWYIPHHQIIQCNCKQSWGLSVHQQSSANHNQEFLNLTIWQFEAITNGIFLWNGWRRWAGIDRCCTGVATTVKITQKSPEDFWRRKASLLLLMFN